MTDDDDPQQIGPTGVLVYDGPAHTPGWYAARNEGIGASEIAAVLGISPWTSPFDLYWRKVTREEGEPSESMSWGLRLESAICDHFAGLHPEFDVQPTGVIAHKDRLWQRASPDRLACGWTQWDDTRLDVAAALEAKTDGGYDGWGEEGTDEIPPHYLAQVRWQLDTLGLQLGYVAALFGGNRYREYVIEHDEADAALMRDAAAQFWQRVQDREAPPIDGHVATTGRLKLLHPDVDDAEVDLPADLIQARRTHDLIAKAAIRERDAVDNQVRELLGRARVGVVAGDKAVSRSVYELKEQVRRATTVDRLNFTRPKENA